MYRQHYTAMDQTNRQRKTKSPVEFRAKVDHNGLGRIENYDAYNESTVFEEAAECFKERIDHYQERLLADSNGVIRIYDKVVQDTITDIFASGGN